MLTDDIEIIRELLKHGADPHPLYQRYKQFFRECSSENPPPTPFNILVLRNASTGKTTLIESLKEEGKLVVQQGCSSHYGRYMAVPVSWKYTHPVNMGIPGFPFLRDFRDPVVIIGTPLSTQTADDTVDAYDSCGYNQSSGKERPSVKRSTR